MASELKMNGSERGNGDARLSKHASEFSLGINLDPVPGGLVVTSVHPGGAAASSGRIVEGDILLAINDIEVEGKDSSWLKSIILQSNPESGGVCILRVRAKLGGVRNVVLNPRAKAVTVTKELREAPISTMMSNGKAGRAERMARHADSCGIGIELCDSPDGPMIASLSSSGAARWSGKIDKGDIVVQVDGQPTMHTPARHVAMLIDGGGTGILEISLLRPRPADPSVPPSRFTLDLPRSAPSLPLPPASPGEAPPPASKEMTAQELQALDQLRATLKEEAERMAGLPPKPNAQRPPLLSLSTMATQAIAALPPHQASLLRTAIEHLDTLWAGWEAEGGERGHQLSALLARKRNVREEREVNERIRREYEVEKSRLEYEQEKLVNFERQKANATAHELQQERERAADREAFLEGQLQSSLEKLEYARIQSKYMESVPSSEELASVWRYEKETLQAEIDLERERQKESATAATAAEEEELKQKLLALQASEKKEEEEFEEKAKELRRQKEELEQGYEEERRKGQEAREEREREEKALRARLETQQEEVRKLQRRVAAQGTTEEELQDEVSRLQQAHDATT